MALGAGVLSVVAAGQWVFAGQLTALFAPKIDGAAAALAIASLQIYALGYPAKGVLPLAKAGFYGVRRTRTTMVASLAQTWLLGIPFAVVAGLVLGYGAIGVFWPRTASIVVAAVALGAYYLSATNDGRYARAAERMDAVDD